MYSEAFVRCKLSEVVLSSANRRSWCFAALHKTQFVICRCVSVSLTGRRNWTGDTISLMFFGFPAPNSCVLLRIGQMEAQSSVLFVKYHEDGFYLTGNESYSQGTDGSGRILNRSPSDNTLWAPLSFGVRGFDSRSNSMLSGVSGKDHSG